MFKGKKGHGREANQAYHPQLGVAKEPQNGYISDTGQVFLTPTTLVHRQPLKGSKEKLEEQRHSTEHNLP